jgi:hypothetical protein
MKSSLDNSGTTLALHIHEAAMFCSRKTLEFERHVASHGEFARQVKSGAFRHPAQVREWP